MPSPKRSHDSVEDNTSKKVKTDGEKALSLVHKQAKRIDDMNKQLNVNIDLLKQLMAAIKANGTSALSPGVTSQIGSQPSANVTSLTVHPSSLGASSSAFAGNTNLLAHHNAYPGMFNLQSPVTSIIAPSI